MEREQQSKYNVQSKGGRKWILPSEYDAFMTGVLEAMRQEESGIGNGPFNQLLKYKPCTDNAGFFPPVSYWFKDMCRILFGLAGPEGDEMRKADLSVYDGVPFGKISGRKRIMENPGREEYLVVAAYWKDKIREENKSITKENADQLRFLFNKNDFLYYNSKLDKNV